MAKYTITALRFKDIPYSDKITGAAKTFRKYEVQTDLTGKDIIELRLGTKAAGIKVGDSIAGHMKKTGYTGKNGWVDTQVLEGITVEYIYSLLLKKFPDIESLSETKTTLQKEDMTPDEQDNSTGEIPF